LTELELRESLEMGVEDDYGKKGIRLCIRCQDMAGEDTEGWKKLSVYCCDL
jgi:hypothetical protein